MLLHHPNLFTLEFIKLQNRATKHQSPSQSQHSVTQQLNGYNHSNENNGVVKERKHSINSQNSGNSIKLVT